MCNIINCGNYDWQKYRLIDLVLIIDKNKNKNKNNTNISKTYFIMI